MENLNGKSYKIICPGCGKVQYACKSLGHKLGILDAGYGECLECALSLKIVYDPDKDDMTAYDFNKYVMGDESND